MRINILDNVQDFVTPRCQISHLVVPKQQNGSPNQQMVNPFQQNGYPRKYKMGCANYMEAADTADELFTADAADTADELIRLMLLILLMN